MNEAKLGFVADLLSKPTQIGYMNGLALTIIVGQLPKLCGFSVKANGLIHEARGFIHGLASGEAVGAAVAVGLIGPLEPDHFVHTLDAAVEAFREQTGAEWEPAAVHGSKQADGASQTIGGEDTNPPR